MDKKSTLIGILLLASGFILMTWNSMRVAESQPRPAPTTESAPATAVEAPDTRTAKSFSPSQTEITTIEQIRAELPEAPTSEAEIPTVKAVLENAFIKATLSSIGGSIETIELKKFPKENPHETDNPGSIHLNAIANVPALSFSQTIGTEFSPFIPRYTLLESSRDRIIFEGFAGNLRIRRIYALKPGEGEDASYVISHKTEMTNVGPSASPVGTVFFNMGTAAPSGADPMGYTLNASYLRDGDYKSISSSKFRGGGFIFKSEPQERVERIGSIEWGSVKNQFFTTILIPEKPAEAIVATRVKFPLDPQTEEHPIGVSGSLRFSIPTLAAGSTETLSMDLYAGPKDFDRLSRLGNKQEDVLQLGWFLGLFVGFVGFIGKMLLTLLGGVHNFVGNWGMAIIITTLIIRLFLYPLTAKAARASKRMQKLSKPLQEIREKYADNQQKLNEEMLKLWKRHKINPLSGCWPVLLQFPIFISFFNLLRNSADLRYAEFLWINDLSMPDRTISLGDLSLPFFGSHINVLPFVWLVSMWFQMKMMPSPSIDNSQAKIIKFMPFIFFPFTYIFSSGLVLYWTTTNGFSILQQWLTNRIKDDEDEAIEHEIEEADSKKKLKSNAPLISKKKKKKNP